MRRAMEVLIAGLIVTTTVLGAWNAAAIARIEPCLLTPADIEDAIGIEVEQEFEGLAECSYVSESGEAGEAASVRIQLSENESKKDATRTYKDQRFLVTRTERVDDVGNAAFYSFDLGDMVVFRKGTTVVSLGLLIFGEELDPHRDEVIALAQAAADKL
ncbi:MAG: hypothetical protein FJW86_12705 [Actinobacteria bacterium]|nr:hypothetical protein [Actinomycetota bacterium]